LCALVGQQSVVNIFVLGIWWWCWVSE